MSIADPLANRPREIVRLASQKTELEAVRLWLFEDSIGGWERTATEYLESTKKRAEELGLTEEEVNDQIALRLAHMACEVMLREARRKIHGH